MGTIPTFVEFVLTMCAIRKVVNGIVQMTAQTVPNLLAIGTRTDPCSRYQSMNSHKLSDPIFT